MNLLIIAPQLTDMTCFLTPSEERTDQSQGQNSSAPCRSYSLYVAKKLKLQDPSINISVLSFGTAKVISKLHDYIAICADQAFLLSDIDLNGPGPVFLGKVLADTVRYIEDRHGDYSLILIDEAFVQSDGILFGPIIAENMGLQTIYPANGTRHGLPVFKDDDRGNAHHAELLAELGGGVNVELGDLVALGLGGQGLQRGCQQAAGAAPVGIKIKQHGHGGPPYLCIKAVRIDKNRFHHRSPFLFHIQYTPFSPDFL